MGSGTPFSFYLAMVMVLMASFLSNSRVKSKCTISSTISNNFTASLKIFLTGEILEYGKFVRPSAKFPNGQNVLRRLKFYKHISPSGSGTFGGLPCPNGSSVYFVSATARFHLSIGDGNCRATTPFFMSNNDQMYHYRVWVVSSPVTMVHCSLHKG